MSKAGPTENGNMRWVFQVSNNHDLAKGDTRNLSSHLIVVEDGWNNKESLKLNLANQLLGNHTRPYFLDKQTMARLQQTVTLGILCVAFPWKWNKQQARIGMWSPPLLKVWRVLWTLFVLQTTCLTIYQVYSFVKHLNVKETILSH